LADPPWRYRTWTAKGGRKSASAHYKTMDTKQICKLPIKKLCDNGVLFLWAIYPNLPDAFDVMKAWGFDYKTVAFTWIKTYSSGKPVVGLGYWTRANAEICLLGTRGKYPRRKNKGISQIIMEKPTSHSAKPPQVRNKITKLMGDLTRIELFARKPNKLFDADYFEGWDVWGNEVENDIDLQKL
jgi:N6-adenosine-specific RNA methylase IME4